MLKKYQLSMAAMVASSRTAATRSFWLGPTGLPLGLGNGACLPRRHSEFATSAKRFSCLRPGALALAAAGQ
jgi:hypothetical protein